MVTRYQWTATGLKPAKQGAALYVSEYDYDRLLNLVSTGVAVVEDFMPNIGKCALQDYGRLNDFLIESAKVLKHK